MTEKEVEAGAEVGAEEDLAEAAEEGGGIRISSINLNRTSSSAHSSISSSSSSSISGSHRRGISGPRALIRAPIGGPLSQPRSRLRWAPLLLASGL